MTFGNVQRVKVVEISLDFAIVFDDIAERDEDVFDPLPHQSNRMKMSRPRTSSRNGDVDPFTRRAGGVDHRFQFLFRRIERLGDLRFCLLDNLTKSRPLFWGDSAD